MLRNYLLITLRNMRRHKSYTLINLAGLGWGIFALSGVLALCLALLTVGWQATKAAHANPVDTLPVE